jgi:hypothetical protein
MTGKNELKLRYQELFKISPDLHVEVSNRRIKDGYIIDREDVVGLRGEPGHRYFIVKTRVTKGLIVEVIIEPE